MIKQLCMTFLAFVVTVTATANDPNFPPSMASYTLPVICIDTEDSRPVIDKVTQIPASFSVITESGGAADTDYPAMTIRGRGNVSWQREKKPYKLKFNKKTELLGMPANKHFALVPQQGYCDIIAIMMEREAARLLDLGWVPRGEPVELVLNGRYDGIYLLSETVKVHPDRLDIFGQPDNCTDPELIEGGWLLEIDNYDDPAQIVIKETADKDLRLTYHCPEKLSPTQLKWLRNEMTKVNAAIYSNDSTGMTWAEYIDAESAVRYFLSRELFHDYDGYNGSFYIHKDLGQDCKWHFGPLWDPGFGKHKTDWIVNDHPEAAETHWIEPLFATSLFRNKAADEWFLFEPRLPELYYYGRQLSIDIREAMIANNKRWPDQDGNSATQFSYVHGGLINNASWIGQQLSHEMAPTDAPEGAVIRSEYFSIQGIRVDEDDLRPGIYICRDADGVRKIVRH